MQMFPELAALDKDEDGEISSEELQNAPAALKTLDKDANGELSRNAQLLVGRFSLSHCGLIGWRGSRCVATGERDPQERESRALDWRNPLAGPVRER